MKLPVLLKIPKQEYQAKNKSRRGAVQGFVKANKKSKELEK